jgi:hypothetical protein
MPGVDLEGHCSLQKAGMLQVATLLNQQALPNSLILRHCLLAAAAGVVAAAPQDGTWYPDSPEAAAAIDGISSCGGSNAGRCNSSGL